MFIKKSLHFLFRSWIKATSYFFFEKIIVTGTENLPKNCPAIFACNHPNAFLDSIVMTTVAQRPLHYTARGDFFKSKIAAGLLNFIQILPVYRREEGKELMHKNAETFSACIELFKENGAVIIFSEGLSENKWELRPLRKGTARLAFEAWSNPEVGDKLKVVPVAIHYSSWLKIHPKIYVEFLPSMEKQSFGDLSETGLFNKNFNDLLRATLISRCIQVDNSKELISQNKITGFILKNYINGAIIAKKLQNKYFTTDSSKFKSDYKALADFLIKENINYDLKPDKGIMKTINLIGWFIVFGTAGTSNFIPYYICKFLVRSTKGNDFHDSLLYCMLLIIYPIYLVTIFVIIHSLKDSVAAIIVAFLTVYSAHYYESSKRYILSYFKRDKLKIVEKMFRQLFETSNG